jgi:hypothetical protein
VAERGSWAVQQVAGVGVQTVEDARHSMAALWTPAGAVTSRSGMVPTGAAAVPGSVLQTTPTANTFVHVQPIRYVRQSSRGGGTYTMVLDSIKDIDVLNPANGGTAADPANARIDLIIAQQSDAYFGDANSNMVVKRVVGTPAGTPLDPTVTGSADYVLLARITVPANATSIVTANIANVALPSAVAVGGLLPVATQAERDALVTPFDGMQVYRRDMDWIEVYDSTAWRAPAFLKTAALANITNPYTGQHAHLTTDDNIYRYNGTVWAPRGPVRYNAIASSDLAIGTADNDVPGATVTFTTVAANALAKVRADFDWRLTATGTGYCYGSLYVDGTRHTKQALYIAQSAETRLTSSMGWDVVLATAGSHTLKLSGHKDINAGTAFHCGGQTQISIDLFQ